MDYLEKNIDWLQSKLEPLLKGLSIGPLFLSSFIHSVWNGIHILGAYVEYTVPFQRLFGLFKK